MIIGQAEQSHIVLNAIRWCLL